MARDDSKPFAKIRVFRDDPVWDAHARWFMVPMADLERLHVITFEISGDPYEGIDAHVREVEEQYPGHVLVY